MEIKEQDIQNGVTIVKDSNGNPLIFQNGKEEEKTIFVYKDDDGKYRVALDIKSDLSTKLKNSIKLFNESLVIGNLLIETNLIFEDPACYSGCTRLRIVECEKKDILESGIEEKTFDINEVVKLSETGVISDPFVKVAIQKVVQLLRKRSEYKYEDVAISYRPKQITGDPNINHINLNLSEKYSYLGRFANLNKATIENEEQILREKEDIVAVLSFDENGNVILTRQERGGVGGYSVELPAGRIEKEEKISEEYKIKIEQIKNDLIRQDAQEEEIQLAVSEVLAEYTALKELNEETGAEVNILKISQYNTSNTIKHDGSGPSTTRLYMGFGAKKAKNKLKQDKGENVERFTVTFPEFLDMIQKGMIKDTNSIVSAYTALEIFERQAVQLNEQDIDSKKEEVEQKLQEMIELGYISSSLEKSMQYMQLANYMESTGENNIQIINTSKALGSKILLSQIEKFNDLNNRLENLDNLSMKERTQIEEELKKEFERASEEADKTWVSGQSYKFKYWQQYTYSRYFKVMSQNRRDRMLKPQSQIEDKENEI